MPWETWSVISLPCKMVPMPQVLCSPMPVSCLWDCPPHHKGCWEVCEEGRFIDNSEESWECLLHKATLLRNSYSMAKLPLQNIEDGNEMSVGRRSPDRHSLGELGIQSNASIAGVGTYCFQSIEVSHLQKLDDACISKAHRSFCVPGKSGWVSTVYLSSRRVAGLTYLPGI